MRGAHKLTPQLPWAAEGCLCPHQIIKKAISAASGSARAAGGSGGDGSVGGTLPLALAAEREPDGLLAVSCSRAGMGLKHPCFLSLNY